MKYEKNAVFKVVLVCYFSQRFYKLISGLEQVSGEPLLPRSHQKQTVSLVRGKRREMTGFLAIKGLCFVVV